MRKFGSFVAAVCLTLLPSAAGADWLFTPSLALPFGGDTLERRHAAYGFSAALMDEEGFGVEADLGVAPRFFNGNREDFTGSGSVFTLMGNLIVAATGQRFVPYVVGGVGFMQMRVTSDEGTFTTTTRETGYNVGGGVSGFVSPHIGIRGELRYIRSFQNQEPSWTRGVDVDIAPGAFDFFRAGIGLTIRIP
jgi:opacity protein-like surface antigen